MSFFVAFHAPDAARLDALERVVVELRRAKESDEWHDDAHWLAFFDESARRTFWWPTDDEREEHSRRWFATPVEQRFTDPSLQTPWDFGSMIDALRNGDYALIGLRRVGGGGARLEYEPYGHPYGGSGCMVALIESFGFHVTDIRD